MDVLVKLIGEHGDFKEISFETEEKAKDFIETYASKLPKTLSVRIICEFLDINLLVQGELDL